MRSLSKKSWSLLLVSLLCISLVAVFSGCSYFEADEESDSSTGTGSGGGSASGDSFVIAAGVTKKIDVTLPYTLRFTLKTSADLKNYDNGQRAFIVYGQGTVNGTTDGLAEMRTYKARIYDQNGDCYGEPRFAPAINWQPNTNYDIEVTHNSSGATFKINNTSVTTRGTTASKFTYYLGDTPAGIGYTRPSLLGSTITMK